MNRLANLATICKNCGKPFGWHGARAPHTCPTEEISPGKLAEPTTNFARELPAK